MMKLDKRKSWGDRIWWGLIGDVNTLMASKSIQTRCSKNRTWKWSKPREIWAIWTTISRITREISLSRTQSTRCSTRCTTTFIMWTLKSTCCWSQKSRWRNRSNSMREWEKFSHLLKKFPKLSKVKLPFWRPLITSWKKWAVNLKELWIVRSRYRASNFLRSPTVKSFNSPRKSIAVCSLPRSNLDLWAVWLVTRKDKLEPWLSSSKSKFSTPNTAKRWLMRGAWAAKSLCGSSWRGVREISGVRASTKKSRIGMVR